MKRFLCVLMISFFIVQSADAQVEKGYNLVGGSMNIGMDSDRFVFALMPVLGWFVKDRLAVGGQIFLYVNDVEFGTAFLISLMPFCRYYFGKSNTKFFVHGAIGIGSQTYWSIYYYPEYTKRKRSETDFNYDLRAGVAHFIVDQVALEGALVYRKHGLTSEDFGNFGIDVGIQVHIFRFFKRNKEEDIF